ncbi:GlxA family transcriptional regulator [Pseudomonas sp.]|uniref:GlxA family transcriptional regulator n=1 Tax=Pseudomonas sp. TaxID=306 RepID=UPI0026112D49|nr:GlxA family transcriptional regulator [Pseudomonas sp.]
MPTPLRTVYLLAFPDVQLLDISGPLQVFATANDLMRKQGHPLSYMLKVVAAEPDAVVSSAGLGLLTSPLPRFDEPCDTLIIAGGRGVDAASEKLELVRWVCAQAAMARRLASVCSGAFLLAAGGLLDGRRVVTHWSRCEELAFRYPTLQVEPDPIFINEGAVWTSAGVTAGIDLALALVEEDLGHEVALAVARHLVVFLKRPGGQSQFSVTLALQKNAGRFAELHAWIAENLSGDLSVAILAERVGMSERSFVRHYRAETGSTPARAIEQLRVEAARRLLGDTGLPIKRVASRCGFGTEETLRRSFLRAVAVTPQAYRERFAE